MWEGGAWCLFLFALSWRGRGFGKQHPLSSCASPVGPLVLVKGGDDGGVKNCNKLSDSFPNPRLRFVFGKQSLLRPWINMG